MKIQRNVLRQRGMGFVQMIATIAIIGILSGVALLKMSTLRDRGEKQLLESHVVTFNVAAKLYTNSGGSLAGLTSAQAVVDKLKTVASNGEKIAGFSGSLIDPRLVAIEQTDEEAATEGEWRAIWDPVLKAFELVDRGSKGIKAFRIDSTTTPGAVVTEERQATFELAATESGVGAWVWDFDRETVSSVSPVTTVVDGDVGLDIDPTVVNSTRSQLLQPSLIPGPSTYPLMDYGIVGKDIAITNPNDEAVSQLLASINGSAWSIVANGGSVNVPPGGSLSTFAQVKPGSEDLYFSSHVLTGRYEGLTVQLSAPNISTSASAFHPLSMTAITLTLTRAPNTESTEGPHSKLSYRLGTGDWQDYTGPVALSIADHLQGVAIEAKTVAIRWPEYYLDSPVQGAALTTQTYALKAPELAFSQEPLHPLTAEEVTLTITDPNLLDGSFSQVQYALDDGEWMNYSAPVNLPIDDYSSGVTVKTKAVPTIYVGAFLESLEVSDFLDAEHVTLSPVTIALSEPDFHALDHAEVTATLSSSNPESVSGMEYSLDAGATWESYSEPFALSLLDHLNGAAVEARAVATVHLNNIHGSATTSKSIGVAHAILADVSISSSAPVLSPQGYPTATITLSNPNSSDFSKAVYSLDEEVTWVDYVDPFVLSVEDYPEGVTIIARSEPILIPEHISASGTSSVTLPVPPKLEMVTFSRAPGGYVKSQYDAGIVISNPNGAWDSETRYRVNGGDWEVYTDAVVLTSWPATIEAYAASTDYINYQDSETNSGAYERIYLTPSLAFSVEGSGLPNLVHEFTGEAYGRFKDPVGYSELTYVIENNYFEWGESTGYLGFENGNWLQYTGASWDGVQAGEYFRLGTLDYFNGEVYMDTTATGVTLELTIALTMPETNEMFDIHLDLESTPNVGTEDENADYVRIGNLYSDFTTELDGIQYGLNLAFGYVGSNQGFTTVDEFHVHEAATATADLWGFFTTPDY